MTSAPPGLRSPAFGRYWAGAGFSSFGSAVTTVAMPVLVIEHLGASGFEVGLVSAAQLVPYAALGLVAGAYVDRWRRRPVLVWSSLGRAVCLAAVPALWFTGVLQLWMLLLALLAFGCCSVFGFAATQSLLPRLVAREDLVAANARIDATDAASQAAGPAIGGVLVAALTAPVALVVDAASYLVEAVLVALVRVDEPRPAPGRRDLLGEIREGLAFMYRHPLLARLGIATHLWFLAQGAAMVTLSLLALRRLGFSGAEYGALLATFGGLSLVGAATAPRLARRLGAGRAVVLARVAYPLAWLLPLLAGPGALGHVLVFAGLALLGLAAGAESSPEMALWQAHTPDTMLGRVNGARRSANRTLAALGALVAGVALDAAGARVVLVGVVALFAAAAVMASGGVARARSEAVSG